MSEQNISLLSNALECSGCSILSLVIIASGTINNYDNQQMVCKKMIGVFNITHTDSYNQTVNSRINSMYSHLNAQYIFPLCVFKNNIINSEQSTGNINRNINNNLWLDLSVYNLVIGLDNIKQNIPRQNYYLSNSVISIFNEICLSYNMELVYFSSWADNFEKKINKLVPLLEKQYNIQIIKLDNNNYSLTKTQQQYFKQNGIYN